MHVLLCLSSKSSLYDIRITRKGHDPPTTSAIFAQGDQLHLIPYINISLFTLSNLLRMSTGNGSDTCWTTLTSLFSSCPFCNSLFSLPEPSE